MSESILVKVNDEQEAIVNEIEKNHCFFVGKADEATNAFFEKAYEITHVNWPKDLFASYQIGARSFTAMSFTKGAVVATAKGSYKLKKHPDGTVYLHMNLEYPVHDAYERMYSRRFERVIYRENGEVVVLQAKHGQVLPKINVFVGLKESVPYLDRLLAILDDADAAQLTRLSMLTRCVAQKYRLSEESAERIEKFVLYTCLDAANISASFGIFKSKKKTLSYDLLKATADYVCGACFPEWYTIAPGRRYERLGDLIDYIRSLQTGKHPEWNSEEKAFCHAVRKWIDASVFADVYAVSLVLMRFLAENSFSDVYSFRTVATAPGIFSSTLMADTVDRFSASQLDGEAKKVFFSLVGKVPENVKTRVERALYRYHGASNVLFCAAQSLTTCSGLAQTKREAQIIENAAEHTTLSLAARAALSAKKQIGGQAEHLAEDMQEILAEMSQNFLEIYNIDLDPEDEFGTCLAIGEKLNILTAECLEEETEKALSGEGKTVAEIMREFVPESSFVFVYVAAFTFVRILHQSFANREVFAQVIQQNTDSILNALNAITPEELKVVIAEAKYRYGAMCGAGLLETMAQKKAEK